MRNVVVLAPMPLEMKAIIEAFALSPAAGRVTHSEGPAVDDYTVPFTGRVGDSAVTAIHIGMGPRLTRKALISLLDESVPGHVHVDHVMNSGICGGLDPDLEVGTLINPAILVDHSSGKEYRHRPPVDEPLAGKLITTEVPTLDIELSKSFFANGCIAVDMESAAVAEVCESRGVPFSIYRCIGDRYVDGLLDERVLKLSNPDGSGNTEALKKLLEEEPEVVANLERLSRETSNAARLAAEATVRGCLALDAL